MKRLFEFLTLLIFPPRCAACGKLLSPKSKRAHVLCESCDALWRAEQQTQCKECFLPYHTCRCTLPNMKKQGIVHYVKLAPYEDETEKTVAKRMVVGVKDHADRRTFRYLAAELATGVSAAIEALERTRRKNGEPPLKTVVCHLPRTKRGVRRAGFDQAKELAKALAGELNYPYIPLLKRVRDGLPQKELTRRERAENLRGAFKLTANACDFRVLLVDDVVTTGSGMTECARVLQAAEVIAVSVAFTEKKKTK